MSSDSYIDAAIPPFDSDDIDSLPSSSTSSQTSETTTEYQLSSAQKEWEESLEQLELILTMVLVPYVGKYFGRKAAYWGWAKYMTWYYPVEVKVTNSTSFKATGAVAAAAL